MDRFTTLAVSTALALILPVTLLASDRPCSKPSTMSALGSLSESEREAVRDEKPSGSVVVAEAIDRIKSMPARKSEGVKTQSIPWTDARKIILMGAAEVVFVTHSGAVSIVSKSGQKYTAQQPSPGMVVALVGIVDPCHIFVSLELE